MDTTFVGFDTETTGVSPHHSRLVTASIIVTGQNPERHEWLADPGVEIPSAASAVHGISTEKARTHGRPVAEVLPEIRDILLTHLRAGHPVVAFNASFDLTLLESELVRHGHQSLTELLGGEPTPIIDPLVLDRMIDRYRKGPRRLESLCAHYRVEASGFHDASADVEATLAVLEAMMKTSALLRSSSLAKLHELQKNAHASWAESFNQFLASKGKKPDVDPSWPLLSSPETPEN